MMRDYDKALKRLAGQITRAIKIDTTYRDIPFGAAQLDIHSDGNTVLLAVKILVRGKKSFKVREFQMPASKLRKFLVGSEMNMFINNSDINIYHYDHKIMKQISRGIAELVHDSEKKTEFWVFPFHNHMIVFKKDYKNADFKGLHGQIAFTQNEKPYSSDFFIVSGILLRDSKEFAQNYFVHMSIEYRIYHALTRNSFTTQSVEAYKKVSESSMWLDAA